MCIIKGFRPKFIISVLYINDMNIIGTPGELENITYYLKEKFKKKDLDKTKFCLTEHPKIGFWYINPVIKINNSHPLTNPAVVRHLVAENEQFRHYEKYEKLLGPEVPYFSWIGAVMYIQYIVLAEQDDSRIESYTFLSTSSILNKLFIHLWRKLSQHIRENCVITSNKDVPTILHEDKRVYRGQQNQTYITKFFFTQKECGINIQKIQSCNNLADLFIKSLPTSKFEKMVRNIGMRRFKEINYWQYDEEEEGSSILGSHSGGDGGEGALMWLVELEMNGFQFDRPFGKEEMGEWDSVLERYWVLLEDYCCFLQGVPVNSKQQEDFLYWSKVHQRHSPIDTCEDVFLLQNSMKIESYLKGFITMVIKEIESK
ncbi:hypothetical protein LXL04_029787 [Taraxacum kok-saghyz]